jgi:hypothetical protein
MTIGRAFFAAFALADVVLFVLANWPEYSPPSR